MEFILPLDPGVRVLHYHYLADALGVDDASALVVAGEDGGTSSYGGMLEEIDALPLYVDDDDDESANDGAGGDATLLERIGSILDSRLPTMASSSSSSSRRYSHAGRRQHLCLLRQYALNRKSGRSVRGTTMVYVRPHVSTYYRGGNDNGVSTSSSSFSSSKDDALSVISRRVEPNYKIPPASLSFTGYAAKFINLSVNPINLYWDGGRIPSGPNAGEMRTVLVGTVISMGSIGTSTFPGHSFHITPTYDKDHVIQRWTVTEDEPVLYYDPLSDMRAVDRIREVDRLTREGKWTERARFERDAWVVDRSFGRDYLVKTGMAWLANFPQPYMRPGGGGEAGDAVATTTEDDRRGAYDDDASSVEAGISARDGHRMHMWRAEYIGQTHDVVTSNLYYNSLPERLGRLTYDDYRPHVEGERLAEMRRYQTSSLKGKKKKNGDSGDEDDDDDGTTMRLTLSVLSCAPRVLQARRFLSPVEVQHLIDLASGASGGVIMERSTVSASNVKGDGERESDRDGKGSRADTRTSTGGWIHREQDAIVDTIFRRIADLLNIDERLMRDLVRDHPDDDDSGGDGWLPTHERIVEAVGYVLLS